MPITYTPALNRITITGYALGAECTFTDVYNADKAGTFSLHARVGVAAVDGAPVAVTNALRPTDYVVLGGASGDLYITIANWNLMTNATIQIVGTDRDGAAQTENIAVIGNGNYNTTMWFKTITSTQITVFNTPGGGTFDYDLIQGQWGVVWKTGNQFYFQAYIRLGVGVTWFADTAKQVEFDPALATAGAAIFTIHWSSHLRLGTLIDATLKTSRDGCSITCLGVSGWFDLITCAGDGTVELYSSTFTSSTQNCQVQARSSSRLQCSTKHCVTLRPYS